MQNNIGVYFQTFDCFRCVIVLQAASAMLNELAKLMHLSADQRKLLRAAIANKR
jgi:hypothetical protein